MWSPWACVSAIRVIGASSAAAAARIFLAPCGNVVSISVRPSSSRTRYALTKPQRLTRMVLVVVGMADSFV